jgi:hypothetical protein
MKTSRGGASYLRYADAKGRKVNYEEFGYEKKYQSKILHRIRNYIEKTRIEAVSRGKGQFPVFQPVRVQRDHRLL